MWFIPIILLFVFFIGIYEKKRHQKNVDAIPIRVNINGIRGKSTVTRLVTGILKEAGYRTVGKTTGTDARMIYSHTSEEKQIIRKPQGPNIGEQKEVVKEAADLNAEALVSECMAVNPDYQIVFQNELIQANIGVIVNVLEDHMDVMGPTLDEIAEAFTATIPYDGHLIVSDSPYTPYFGHIAKQRNTKMIVADNSKISEEFLRQFEYMIFPENASLALAVAEALDIDKETAFRGMLNAQPDPGAMRILPVLNEQVPSYFVNGFAGNDPTSTLNIWKRINDLGYPADKPIIVMNCRADRVDRTKQFAKDVLPQMDIGKLVVIGETTSPIAQAYREGIITADELIDCEHEKMDDVIDKVVADARGKVIYGIGNIHGEAEPFIRAIESYKITQRAS
ncbi:MAG TPA: poly-gamma-glutamate synthase PgsB [Bacillota bacterium]|nr:poly-gamma-glutamate synthase PgsB [Bacillota bacterium]